PRRCGGFPVGQLFGSGLDPDAGIVRVGVVSDWPWARVGSWGSRQPEHRPDRIVLPVHQHIGHIEGHLAVAVAGASHVGRGECVRSFVISLVDRICVGAVWPLPTDDGLEWKNKDPSLVVDFPNTGVSVDYGKTMRWQFVEGRDFSKHHASDSTGFILNQAAVKFMGLTDPVGETIRWDGKPFTVIGVIRDVIVESPFKPVRPAIYCMARNSDNYLFIRVKQNADVVTATKEIAKIFKKYSPSQPFDFKFVEDEYDNKFFAETQVNRLAKLFSGLAILISALGLFGLTTFIAEQRRKEMGLRKVLGASVMNLWMLLTSEFVLLVVLSCVVAAPIAWLYVNNWLQQFEYRVVIDWSVFVSIALGCLLLTIFTVSFKALKAARTSPVTTLKT
ncbi:MAG: FtsX-like permease family protein, partial [Chitinophagaceae bacterium]